MDWEAQWFDVLVRNPDSRIYGYQLAFDGLQISITESLLDVADGYTGAPAPAPGGQEVLTLSYDGTSIPKHTTYTPLLRVHWVGNANGMVCLSGVSEVVNEWLQTTLVDLDDPCQEQVNSACPGDLDGDLVVTVSDILNVLSEFGWAAKCTADLNGDGAVNVTDVLLVLSAFGTSCN